MSAFEWDEGKAALNLAKHGVSFDEASTVFADPLAVCFPDPDHSVGESRFVLVGYASSGRLLFVAHKELKEGIRIISARQATAFERKRHEQHT